MPPKLIRMCGSIAGIAQLVEHNLAKVGVASSSLVSRSKDSQQAPVMPGPLHFGQWRTIGRYPQPAIG
jgi:hypothetical protein